MTAGKELPKWISKHLSESDIRKIEEAVAEVESRTQGEIVPMIVRHSIPAEPIQVGITLFLLFSVVFLILHQLIPTPEISEVTIESIGFIGSAVLGFFLARFDFVQHCFVGREEMAERVYEKAELEFYRARVNHTHKSVGILLFLSLTEHRAVVLADKGIAQKLKPEAWLDVVHLMTRAAKEKRLGAGMCDAVRECGKVLGQHFPSDKKGNDEIPNKLVIRDR